jgi:hypothetical protein
MGCHVLVFSIINAIIFMNGTSRRTGNEVATTFIFPDTISTEPIGAAVTLWSHVILSSCT